MCLYRLLNSNAAKRLFDLTIACLGLALLSPFFALIAVIVKISSKGPIFYRGLRTGKNGKPFRIFKFRSMVEDAENRGGTTTGKSDPRVTKVGHILRRYKLDELPQLFNVVTGDMSLVGPRPEVSEYTDQYSEEEKLILSVRPGITDLSSLEFSDLQKYVGSEDPDATFRVYVLPRKIELRMKYVKERSFFGDLKILLTTVWMLIIKPFRDR